MILKRALQDFVNAGIRGNTYIRIDGNPVGSTVLRTAKENDGIKQIAKAPLWNASDALESTLQDSSAKYIGPVTVSYRSNYKETNAKHWNDLVDALVTAPPTMEETQRRGRRQRRYARGLCGYHSSVSLLVRQR